MKRNDCGSTMVMSLLSVIVLTILAATVYRLTKVVIFESLFQERRAQSQGIAEAGLENALHELLLDPEWRNGFSKKSFAGGIYTVALSTDSPPRITSRGESLPIFLFGPVHTTIRARAAVTSTTDCQTISDGLFSIDGKVDAYDSALSTSPLSFGFGGHICSNARVSVSANAGILVRSDVDYYAGPAPSAGAIEGTITRSTYTRILPVNDGTPYINSNDNLTGISPSAFYVDLTKSLAVPMGMTATITSGVYYFDTMDIKGNLAVDSSAGPVNIYLNGSLTLPLSAVLGDGQITNASQIPTNLTIYPQGAVTISLGSAAPLFAVIEGNAASVALDQTLYGNIKAGQITITEKGDFHYDKQTGDSSAIVSHVSWEPGSWLAIP